MIFDQQEFDVRCEWGEQGVAVLAPISDAVIVVDVLSFSTSVDIAVGNGAVVFPYRGRDGGANAFAASVKAELADLGPSRNRLSLSPSSLMHIRQGSRIVLASPNGASLTLAAKQRPVFAGCLRNAQAVAAAARTFGPGIAVIPAGERWGHDQSLRPSWEDLIGAGAIISYLPGKLSPEAASALAAFEAARSRLRDYLHHCSSGRELNERGFGEDVNLASQLNVSQTVPFLVDGAYVRYEAGDPLP